MLSYYSYLHYVSNCILHSIKWFALQECKTKVPIAINMFSLCFNFTSLLNLHQNQVKLKPTWNLRNVKSRVTVTVQLSWVQLPVTQPVTYAVTCRQCCHIQKMKTMFERYTQFAFWNKEDLNIPILTWT